MKPNSAPSNGDQDKTCLSRLSSCPDFTLSLSQYDDDALDGIDGNDDDDDDDNRSSKNILFAESIFILTEDKKKKKNVRKQFLISSTIEDEKKNNEQTATMPLKQNFEKSFLYNRLAYYTKLHEENSITCLSSSIPFHLSSLGIQCMNTTLVPLQFQITKRRRFFSLKKGVLSTPMTPTSVDVIDQLTCMTLAEVDFIITECYYNDLILFGTNMGLIALYSKFPCSSNKKRHVHLSSKCCSNLISPNLNWTFLCELSIHQDIVNEIYRLNQNDEEESIEDFHAITALSLLQTQHGLFVLVGTHVGHLLLYSIETSPYFHFSFISSLISSLNQNFSLPSQCTMVTECSLVGFCSPTAIIALAGWSVKNEICQIRFDLTRHFLKNTVQTNTILSPYRRRLWNPDATLGDLQKCIVLRIVSDDDDESNKSQKPFLTSSPSHTFETSTITSLPSKKSSKKKIIVFLTCCRGIVILQMLPQLILIYRRILLGHDFNMDKTFMCYYLTPLVSTRFIYLHRDKNIEIDCILCGLSLLEILQLRYNGSTWTSVVTYPNNTKNDNHHHHDACYSNSLTNVSHTTESVSYSSSRSIMLPPLSKSCKLCNGFYHDINDITKDEYKQIYVYKLIHADPLFFIIIMSCQINHNGDYIIHHDNESSSLPCNLYLIQFQNHSFYFNECTEFDYKEDIIGHVWLTSRRCLLLSHNGRCVELEFLSRNDLIQNWLMKMKKKDTLITLKHQIIQNDAPDLIDLMLILWERPEISMQSNDLISTKSSSSSSLLVNNNPSNNKSSLSNTTPSFLSSKLHLGIILAETCFELIIYLINTNENKTNILYNDDDITTMPMSSFLNFPLQFVIDLLFIINRFYSTTHIYIFADLQDNNKKNCNDCNEKNNNFSELHYLEIENLFFRLSTLLMLTIYLTLFYDFFISIGGVVPTTLDDIITFWKFNLNNKDIYPSIINILECNKTFFECYYTKYCCNHPLVRYLLLMFKKILNQAYSCLGIQNKNDMDNNTTTSFTLCCCIQSSQSLCNSLFNGFLALYLKNKVLLSNTLTFLLDLYPEYQMLFIDFFKYCNWRFHDTQRFTLKNQYHYLEDSMNLKNDLLNQILIDDDIEKKKTSNSVSKSNSILLDQSNQQKEGIIQHTNSFDSLKNVSQKKKMIYESNKMTVDNNTSSSSSIKILDHTNNNPSSKLINEKQLWIQILYNDYYFKDIGNIFIVKKKDRIDLFQFLCYSCINKLLNFYELQQQEQESLIYFNRSILAAEIFIFYYILTLTTQQFYNENIITTEEKNHYLLSSTTSRDLFYRILNILRKKNNNNNNVAYSILLELCLLYIALENIFIRDQLHFNDVRRFIFLLNNLNKEEEEEEEDHNYNNIIKNSFENEDNNNHHPLNDLKMVLRFKITPLIRILNLKKNSPCLNYLLHESWIMKQIQNLIIQKNLKKKKRRFLMSNEEDIYYNNSHIRYLNKIITTQKDFILLRFWQSRSLEYDIHLNYLAPIIIISLFTYEDNNTHYHHYENFNTIETHRMSLNENIIDLVSSFSSTTTTTNNNKKEISTYYDMKNYTTRVLHYPYSILNLFNSMGQPLDGMYILERSIIITLSDFIQQGIHMINNKNTNIIRINDIEYTLNTNKIIEELICLCCSLLKIPLLSLISFYSILIPSKYLLNQWKYLLKIIHDLTQPTEILMTSKDQCIIISEFLNRIWFTLGNLLLHQQCYCYQKDCFNVARAFLNLFIQQYNNDSMMLSTNKESILSHIKITQRLLVKVVARVSLFTNLINTNFCGRNSDLLYQMNMTLNNLHAGYIISNNNTFESSLFNKAIKESLQILLINNNSNQTPYNESSNDSQTSEVVVSSTLLLSLNKNTTTSQEEQHFLSLEKIDYQKRQYTTNPISSDNSHILKVLEKEKDSNNHHMNCDSMDELSNVMKYNKSLHHNIYKEETQDSYDNNNFNMNDDDMFDISSSGIDIISIGTCMENYNN